MTVDFGSPLYPVLDAGEFGGGDPGPILGAFAGAGVRVAQLRAKEMGPREFLAWARAGVRAARAIGLSVIVNDRVETALLGGGRRGPPRAGTTSPAGPRGPRSATGRSSASRPTGRTRRAPPTPNPATTSPSARCSRPRANPTPVRRSGSPEWPSGAAGHRAPAGGDRRDRAGADPRRARRRSGRGRRRVRPRREFACGGGGSGGRPPPRRGARPARPGGAGSLRIGTVAARVLDGKRLGAEIRADAARKAEAFAAGGRPPGLSVVLVGDDPASAIYVRGKVRACREAGIRSEGARTAGGHRRRRPRSPARPAERRRPGGRGPPATSAAAGARRRPVSCPGSARTRMWTASTR